jgi:hypothetical protein
MEQFNCLAQKYRTSTFEGKYSEKFGQICATIRKVLNGKTRKNTQATFYKTVGSPVYGKN